MKKVAVGIIGYGTVGQGVVEVLQKNAAEIARRCGYQIEIAKVAKRNWQGLTDLPFATTDEPLDIVRDADIDIVIELAGGETAAKTWVEEAFAHGKHVITANKALIAKHGESLFAQAREKNLELAYEAAVAGGIPIIKVLREGMSGNEVSEVAGIINGTCNYILSEMTEKGREFASVLQEAQALGYAEADPSFDIQGTDAAHKLTILASIAFGIPLQFERVYVEGIERISADDIRNAAELGYVIKHLGIAKRCNNGVEIRVHPTLVAHNAPLASVNGVMNAVQVTGNAVGTTLHYGAGAGKLPTASAVVADLIDVVRELNLAQEDRLAEFGYHSIHAIDELPILDASVFHTAFYLRLSVEDKVGVLAKVLQIFAAQGISIESLIQKSALKSNDIMPLVILTATTKAEKVSRAIADLSTLDFVHGEITAIRVEPHL